MNKYIAMVDIAQQICIGVTILQSVPEHTEDCLYLEVPDTSYYGRTYIDGVWGEMPEPELVPESEQRPTLQEQIDALNRKLDEKMDYDMEVNLERDYRLALIEINTAEGGA